ncbi:hypothetical protein E2C01_023939 [Portunus trituberculatus]|uniref:Uncharacterized protein n=1 Tax=Portunus trituberculatus TaxID=210409 RepID=A0A5B7E984_PORTR|nr:hypothetical protein [Portunus trituberculatus]
MLMELDKLMPDPMTCGDLQSYTKQKHTEIPGCQHPGGYGTVVRLVRLHDITHTHAASDRNRTEMLWTCIVLYYGIQASFNFLTKMGFQEIKED